MNTEVSTDLIPEVAEAIEEARQTLIEREEQYREAVRRRNEAQQAKLREEWQKPMETLYLTLPAWIHPYVSEPQCPYISKHSDRISYQYAYVGIQVPGCNHIAAWVGQDVCFEVFKPFLVCDDDTGVWYVSNAIKSDKKDYYSMHGETDIAVALLQAHEAMLRRLELEAVAAERNDPDAEPAVPAEPETQQVPVPDLPDPIDQAVELLGRFGHDASVSPSALIASATIAVAHHVRRIADSLEAK
jgi:hypothetical protein